MAAMGIAKLPPLNNSVHPAHRKSPTPFLASSNPRLSSSFHVSGGNDNILLLRKAAIASGRRTASGARTPVLVSPKAVSDSRSSQTCLDPDASRVSLRGTHICLTRPQGFFRKILSSEAILEWLSVNCLMWLIACFCGKIKLPKKNFFFLLFSLSAARFVEELSGLHTWVTSRSMIVLECCYQPFRRSTLYPFLSFKTTLF